MTIGPPREAIVVIGTSGSLSGESIDQAKVALTLAIDPGGPLRHPVFADVVERVPGGRPRIMR